MAYSGTLDSQPVHLHLHPQIDNFVTPSIRTTYFQIAMFVPLYVYFRIGRPAMATQSPRKMIAMRKLTALQREAHPRLDRSPLPFLARPAVQKSCRCIAEANACNEWPAKNCHYAMVAGLRHGRPF
jgi:hypothetical protein